MMASHVSPTSSPEYQSENRGPLTVGVALAFLVLETAIVSLRFTSRRILKSRMQLDDILVIPAFVICSSLCVLAIIEVKIAGIGQHLKYLVVNNPTAITNWGKCGYAIETLYCTAVVFPKLSILASYLRVFLLRSYRYTTYILGFVVIAHGMAGIMASLASCRPFSARWGYLEHGVDYPKLHCINILVYWRWISLTNIVTDIIMLGLPLPVLWGLHMSVKERIGVVVIFLTGSIGIVTAIIRFRMFFTVKGLINDGTYVTAELVIWSLVEPGIYLIAACLPTLRPLILTLIARFHASKDVPNDGSSTNAMALEGRQQRGNDRRSYEDSIFSC